MVPSCVTPEVLAETATRGPRYTSYPPATELAQITRADIQHELTALRDDPSPISIYIHIPFCRSLCAYCGCNVIPTRDKSREVTTPTRWSPSSRSSPRRSVSRTRSARSRSAVDRRRLPRAGRDPQHRERDRSATSCRRRTRAGPSSSTRARRRRSWLDGVREPRLPVAQRRRAGLRAARQDAIRRHQSQLQTRWLVDRARADGFDDLNVDIVYGLPFQTETSFAETLDTVVGLDPDRIALFGYAHMPSLMPHQRLVERAGRVLDRYERASLLLLAIELLETAGYVHLGLDHFARKGSMALERAAREHTMTRTFQGYVVHRADTILGVGTTAISSTRGAIWQNQPELSAWEAAIEDQELPIARGIILDTDDKIRRAVHREADVRGRGRPRRARQDVRCSTRRRTFAEELENIGRTSRSSRTSTPAPGA